jgi:hypothetical protein
VKATRKVTSILRLGKKNSFLGLQYLEAKEMVQYLEAKEIVQGGWLAGRRRHKRWIRLAGRRRHKLELGSQAKIFSSNLTSFLILISLE